MTSVSEMLTVVDPDRPPTEPAMSLAWMMTEYISLVSLSMFGKAVLMTPMTQRAERINIAHADLHNPYPHWLFKMVLPFSASYGVKVQILKWPIFPLQAKVREVLNPLNEVKTKGCLICILYVYQGGKVCIFFWQQQ